MLVLPKYSNPNKRWRNGREYRRNVLFTRAISKYSWDGFYHIVVFKGLPKHIACREEQLLIRRYRKQGRCYNISNGGEGVEAVSEETKIKISNSCKGKRMGDNNPMRHLTKEQREFHSNKMKETWRNNKDMLDKIRKGIQKAKIEGRLKGNTSPPTDSVREKIALAHMKPVICLSLSNIFIKEYKSISEANMEFNISKKSSTISRACKRNSTAFGFKWKFKDKEVEYGT